MIQRCTSDSLRSAGVTPCESAAELVVDAVCDRLRLAGDHRARDHAQAADGDREEDVDEQHRQAAGHVQGAERAHDRVQQDRDQRGDDEHEHRAGCGGHEQPRAHHGQRQADELNPPRDQDLPLAVGKHRNDRSSRLFGPTRGPHPLRLQA